MSQSEWARIRARPSRVLDYVGCRYAPAVVLAVALLLCATSLRGGQTLDDWVIALVSRGDGAGLGFSSRRWDCFAFTTGAPSENASLMNHGILLPWWSDPGLKLAFFRPLAALTHVLDELWWPSQPFELHAHSLLWFAALLVSVRVLYGRLMQDAWLSNLAFALYAWDDAHGATLGWLANRNALISGVFGVSSIVLHDAWRRSGARWHGWAALACFALSCLASELAVGALAYLIAYAVFLDRAPPRERVRSLLGYVAATVVWRAGWSVAGYGAHGSGVYVDPLSDPAAFLASGPHKWLCLLQGQLGIVPADFGFVGPERHQALWAVTALLTLAGAALLLRPCLHDARGRFWLGGALLALLPMAATFPSDRLLIFVGLGFMPLLARAFRLALERTRAATASSSSRLAPSALALVFFTVHGVLAPALLPLRAGQMGRMARVESSALRELQAIAGSANRQLIVMNAPSVVLASYAQVRLSAQRLPPFERLYVLSATDSPVVVTRGGARQLILRAEQGFLRSPLERHYRSAPLSLTEQGRVELNGLTAEVTQALSDGRPRAVRFTFEHELSDYAFACWREGHFRACEPPPQQQSLRLQAEDLARVLFGSEGSS